MSLYCHFKSISNGYKFGKLVKNVLDVNFVSAQQDEDERIRIVSSFSMGKSKSV